MTDEPLKLEFTGRIAGMSYHDNCEKEAFSKRVGT